MNLVTQSMVMDFSFLLPPIYVTLTCRLCPLCACKIKNTNMCMQLIFCPHIRQTNTLQTKWEQARCEQNCNGEVHSTTKKINPCLENQNGTYRMRRIMKSNCLVIGSVLTRFKRYTVKGSKRYTTTRGRKGQAFCNSNW